MGDRPDDEAPLTSFGTGGLPYYAGESGAEWSPGKSIIVIVLGLLILGLAVVDGSVGLALVSALVMLIGSAWLVSSWRSDRAARRLSRRARERDADPSRRTAD